jgi:hypothetical protein
MNVIRTAALLAGTVFALHAGAVTTRYVAKDLGAMPDGQIAYPTGLNEAGQVVGYILDFNTGSFSAFATGPMGEPMYRPCPKVSTTDCRPVGIDAAGDVVMSIALASGLVVSGASAIDGSGFHYLHGISGGYNAAAGVSPSGLVTGIVFNEQGLGVGDRGNVGGHRPQMIGRVSGRAINDAGVAVGNSIVVNNHPSQAIISVPGSPPQGLGFLPDGNFSIATAISNSGWIAGYGLTANGSLSHALLARLGIPGLTDLGALEPGGFSNAHGVNDAGIVVGIDASPGGNGNAFVLDANNLVMTDLNSLVTLPAGVTLDDAVAINAKGQIAAEGTDGHAYLLTPR